QRRLMAFWRDKTEVWTTLGQAPVIASGFFFVFQAIITVEGESSFAQPLRSYASPSTIIFLGVLSVIWFGSSKSIVEIPGSLTYYHQERLSFLNDLDFIVSRWAALVVITMGQVLLFGVTYYLFFMAIPAWTAPHATGLVTEAHQGVTLWQG